MKNFVVFIISHERADRVETYDTLKRGGYTGKIYIVIDDEDSMFTKYQDRFGEDLLVFNKQSYIECADTLESSRKRASAVYARNAVEDFSERFNLSAFIMLDDDITKFRYRWVENNKLKSLTIQANLDAVFQYYIDFIMLTNIADVAFATVMLYCGGYEYLEEKVARSRQCYAVHIRNREFPVEWRSIINEDLITEQLLNRVGYIFLTLPFVLFESPKINTLSGGVKNVYDSLSEYKRAFLATISLPSSCRPIYSNGHIVIRYSKQQSFPMIISSRYKK